MAAGIRQEGDQVTRILEQDYTGKVDHDVAVFYGLEGKMPTIFRDYREQAKAVYVDLGYWGRRDGGRWTGYHKVVVNSRHPTEYYRKHRHPEDRVAKFGLEIKPVRPGGRHILLAGMGDKAAQAEGFRIEEWERMTIAEIRRYTDRPIRYRPKPSWKNAKPIAGTEYSAPHERDLEHDLIDCHAVVTHHSNVAVDALLAGVPVFCKAGVAVAFARQRFEMIEYPFFPERQDLQSWVADISYTQWNIGEMQRGLPWRHLKVEKLIP